MCTNFVSIWFYLLLQYRAGFETFMYLCNFLWMFKQTVFKYLNLWSQFWYGFVFDFVENHNGCHCFTNFMPNRIPIKKLPFYKYFSKVVCFWNMNIDTRNEVYLQGLKNGMYCTNFTSIWFYLLLQYRAGFETFLDIYVISCECSNIRIYDPSFDMDSFLNLLRTVMVVNVLQISCQIEFQ